MWMQNYLEVVAGRPRRGETAGDRPALVDRYDAIFQRIFSEERGWSFDGVCGASLWRSPRRPCTGIRLDRATAVAGVITLGQMTMYLLVFKQGHAFGAMLKAVGGIRRQLYMRDLYGFLGMEMRPAGQDEPTCARMASAERLVHLPGSTEPALSDVSLHILGTRLALVGHNGVERPRS